MLWGEALHDEIEHAGCACGPVAVGLDAPQEADEQAALRRVATLVARGVRPDIVLAAVAEEVGALFSADGVTIVRFEPDGEATVLGGYGFTQSKPGSRGKPDPHSVLESVHVTGRAARRDSDSRRPQATSAEVRSAVASPIVVEGKVWGAVDVGSRGDRLPSDCEQRLAEFTELVATAIANTESQAELTTSRARIVAAADHARRRIERDLHAGAQQRLVSLALQLRSAQAAVRPEQVGLGAQLDDAIAQATGALDDLRETSRGIHPSILAEGGLGAALRALGRRSPIPVDLEVRVDGHLPEQVELATYYVVAEAVTNAAKHARASMLTVTVDADAAGGLLRVEVIDDGTGGADFTHGTGLVGLKDRVEALGGRILLHSPHGAGTTLRVEVPLTSTSRGASPV